MELFVLLFGAAAGNRGAYVGQKLVVVPRLLDEVGGAVLHGPHRIVDGAVGGDHDHGQARIAGADVGQDLEAIAVGQGKVQQHQVEGMLGQLGQTFFAGGGGCHGVAFELE